MSNIANANPTNLPDSVKTTVGSKTEIKIFYSNGKIKEIIKLKNNKKHGTQKSYSNAAVLLSEINYKEGLLCGNYLKYNAEGKIIEKKHYRISPNKKYAWLHGNYLLYAGKVLITKGAYKDSLKEGGWFEYYNNGLIKSQIIYKNGLQNGEQINYNNNGEIQYSCNYIESIENGKKVAVKHGKYIGYHNSKQISNEGNYDFGKKTGLWREYNQKGDLYRESYYKNGKIHGVNNSYSNEGKLEQKSEFYEEIEIDGKKLTNVYNGIKERYKANGKLESREKYNYGKKEGTWETYHANGNLGETKTFQNNLQTGQSIAYDEDGSKIYDCSYQIIKPDSIAIAVKIGTEMRWQRSILVFETIYKNGKENGLRKSYFPSGKIASSQNFIDDLLQGESIEYYESGAIKSKGSYNSFVAANKDKKFNQTAWSLQFTEAGKLKSKIYFDSLGNPAINYSYNNGKLSQLSIAKVLELNYFPNGKVVSEKIISNYNTPLVRYFYMNGNIRKIGFQNAENLIFNTLHFKNDGKFYYASGSFYNKPDTLLPPQYIISDMIAAAGDKIKPNKFYTDTIKNGNYILNYNNGKTYARMSFINELPDGDFVFYHPITNDTMLYVKFKNGYLNGPWVEKFGGKNLLQRGMYCNQNMCGTWTRNQISGARYEIKKYNAKTGISYATDEFYPNGICKSSNNYETNNYENRDENGNITYRTITFDTLNKWSVNENYYNNSRVLKSRNFYKNKVQDSIAETYYPSGKLQSKMPYKYGKRKGVYIELFENGELKRKSNWENDMLEGMGIVVTEKGIDTLYYHHNNMQVKQATFPCACVDTTHSTARNGFAPMLLHLLEYDDLLNYIPKYLVPIDSLNYRSIFYTGFQNSNSSNSGFSSMNLMMFKTFAFALPSDQQIKLIFNPCITKGYVSRMEINASYSSGNKNYTHVDLYPKRIALEFLKGPVKSADKNYPHFKALFDTKSVAFSAEKKIKLETQKEANDCFVPAIINNTLEINVSKAQPYIYNQVASFAVVENDIKLTPAELELFFGIIATVSKVQLAFYGPKGYQTLNGTSSFLMLGGKYACGEIKINCTKGINEVYTSIENEINFTVEDMRKTLEKNDFSRLKFTYDVAGKQLIFTFYTQSI